MKVVILAGGKGSRISFYTQKIPKPMIKIGNIPLLVHIMNIYEFYGFNDFIIAAGYKSEIIKGYEAVVYQHEIDHLDGVLFTDKVKDNKSLVTLPHEALILLGFIKNFYGYK